MTLPGLPLIWAQSKEDKVKSSLLCDMGHQSNGLALGYSNVRRQAMNKMQAPLRRIGEIVSRLYFINHLYIGGCEPVNITQ